MTRSRKKALLITGIIMALPVLFLVEEHFRGKWALAKLKRQLVAKGEKLTIDECRPPGGEAGDNGFGDFMRAMAMVESASIYNTAPPALRVVTPGKARAIHSLIEWPHLNSGGKAPATNSNWVIFEEAVAASREPLKAAMTALRKPAFDGHVTYSLQNLTMVPHLTTVKRAAQCFGADVLLQLHHGRLDEALHDLEAELRLSFVMREDRMLILQLIRIAVAAMAVGPTWQALQTPGWNDAQLARLQQAWQTNDFLGPMIHAFEMERAMGVDLFDNMRRSGKLAADTTEWSLNWDPAGGSGSLSGAQSFDDLTQSIGERGAKILRRGVYVPLWQFAWSHQDEKNYLETIQQVLDGARTARTQRTVRPSSMAGKEIARREEQRGAYDRMKFLASDMLGGSLSGSFWRGVMMQAQRDLAITAVALKRYELRHGRLAADLDALVPEFLPEKPCDVFDGKPLRYRLREGEGFLLYSVGKDETDDGGDAGPTPAGRNTYFYNGRDLVWPQPATPEEVAADAEKLRRKK